MKKIIISVALILALLLIAGAAFVVYVGNQPEKNPTVVTSKPVSKPPTVNEILRLINEERAKVGVAPLVIDDNVQQSAQLKALDFSARDYYDHKVLGTDKVLTPEMDKLLSSTCQFSSENINADTKTSEQTVKKWMDSPLHKAAILDGKFNLTGIGVSKDNDGDYYTVQHFCIAK